MCSSDLAGARADIFQERQRRHAAADGEKRSLERTIEGFRGFLYCLEGAQEKGIVYGSGAWKKGDIKESPALNEAYEMGRHA